MKTKTFEVIVRGTCTTIIVLDAKSKGAARRAVAEMADEHMLFSGPAIDGDEQYHTYSPAKEWSVKEVEE